MGVCHERSTGWGYVMRGVLGGGYVTRGVLGGGMSREEYWVEVCHEGGTYTIFQFQISIYGSG